ncbi:MAG: PadR family transcriptional regulator [Acidimicrobiales bacterium]
MVKHGMREPSYYVLASLLDGALHGYGIIKKAEELSCGEVTLAAGTLYGALERLAGAGLIESAGDEIVDGRARHYYSLTDVGREAVIAEASRRSAAADVVLARVAIAPA